MNEDIFKKTLEYIRRLSNEIDFGQITLIFSKHQGKIRNIEVQTRRLQRINIEKK